MSSRQRSLTTDLARFRADALVDDALPSLSTAGAAGSRSDRPVETLVVQRPWGTFEQFCCNEAVTVKVITVHPGQRLSLQRHDHRSELWRFLDRPLDVTVSQRTWRAAQGECVWVPQGATHRLGNPCDLPGRVLEIAFGHFDEHDIHRLDDDYARE